MLKVHEEPKEIQREFRGLKEKCEFCQTPTLFWTECKHHPVCPDCAKTHNPEDLKSRATASSNPGE